MIVSGQLVVGPAGGSPRYKLSIPAHAGYSYEVYGNPTLGALTWRALPFSLSQTGAMDRTIHSVSTEGTLDIFVEAKAEKGHYYVAFRVPGANLGTPGTNAAGGGGQPPR